ncbi:MAG TPA: protein-glutamate O-methyltransferase CheR [Candidatus Acidoferrum sp.]|nr:protein-glutamate O-methyltransferase CheR [Candidatus Acidoferrum sp.]
MNQELVYDFELRTAEFAAIRELVLESTGISLSESKRELVKRRFTPRLRALGLDSFTAYIDYVRNNYDAEGTHFCNAITTNLTSFFRESHHYEFLEQVILPEWVQRTRGKGRLRLWSAGCSTGQEAYCLAISVLRVIPDANQRDIRILATDLDENCLARARRGAYETREFDKVPREVIDDWFVPAQVSVKSMQRDAWMATDKLKSLIAFNKLNLVQPWPMHGKFDVIFCRNVFIYFDKPTQEKILTQFAAYQVPGTHLCLGHSETVASSESLGYSLIGKTTYQRTGVA